MRTALICLFLSATLACGADLPPEQDVVAAVLIAEAGGEKAIGIEAVYEVICERAEIHQQTKLEVVTKRLQFSCLNNTTPAELIAKAKKHKYWDVAYYMCGNPPLTPRITNHATHYYSTSLKEPPYWAVGETPVAVIGHHIFYRLK